jgi:hypothetical protein
VLGAELGPPQPVSDYRLGSYYNLEMPGTVRGDAPGPTLGPAPGEAQHWAQY